MSSAAGSALTPISRIVWPFTETRPSSISFSAARRDAIPACDRIFWRRIPSELFTLPCSHFSVRVHVRFRFRFREVRTRTGELLLDNCCPEVHQLEGVHCRCVFVHAGMCDEPTQQHPGPDALHPEMVR